MKLSSKKFCLLIALATLMTGCKKETNESNTEAAKSNQENVVTKDTVKQEPPKPKEDTGVDAVYNVDAVMERYTNENANKEQYNTSDKKIIYLTFDDGPSDLTPKILDILKSEGVHATFFIIGKNTSAMQYVRRAYQEGNAIAAHTYTHEYNIYRSIDSYFEDLNKVQEVIKEQIGHRTKIIRFPGGSSNTVFYKHSHDSSYMIRLTQAVRDSGYQYVDWNLSNGDASGKLMPTSYLISNGCKANHNDICLLMHDTYGKRTTVEALPTIIKYFKNQGYEFGTLTDESYVCHHGIRPYGKNKGGKANAKKTKETSKSESSSKKSDTSKASSKTSDIAPETSAPKSHSASNDSI